MAEITIIPAKERSAEIVRTAAYARVSSDSEDQLNSFAAQIRYYTELLKTAPTRYLWICMPMKVLPEPPRRNARTSNDL